MCLWWSDCRSINQNGCVRNAFASTNDGQVQVLNKRENHFLHVWRLSKVPNSPIGKVSSIFSEKCSGCDSNIQHLEALWQRISVNLSTSSSGRSFCLKIHALILMGLNQNFWYKKNSWFPIYQLHNAGLQRSMRKMVRWNAGDQHLIQGHAKRSY